jgi:hypothetical protein
MAGLGGNAKCPTDHAKFARVKFLVFSAADDWAFQVLVSANWAGRAHLVSWRAMR